MRRLAAWTLVALTGAFAAVRLLGLESGFPLVPLVAYTPLAAAGAVVAALAVAALREWAAAVVAAALAVVLVGAVAPRALGGPTSADGGAGPPLRVLTVNLRRGGADPDAVVALARRTGADVLTLQEVDPRAVTGLERAGLRDLLSERVFAAGPGTTGTALYADHSLTPTNSAAGTTNPLAEARLAVPGAPSVTVTAVHTLAPSTETRARGWRRDFGFLPAAGGSLRVLAGDFNATLDHAPLRDLLATGYADVADQLGAGLRATWPVDRRLAPPVTIDHVLADERIGIRGYDLFELPRSDHRPVLARLELPATAAPR